MKYQVVCLESLGYSLPAEVIDSAEIERRLAPLYERLRLPEGRLELITGVRQRRLWPVDALPSQASIRSAERAIQAAGIERHEIGAVVHGSVCRDYLEPATACRIHHELGLGVNCLVQDVSNACLGLLNGMVQVANMIELGQIRAGLVVGTEDCRALLENTIETLNRDTELSRDQMKQAVASLTIGSGSCAIVLVDRHLSRTDNRLLAAVPRAETRYHHLCHSQRHQTLGGGGRPWMETDSEKLMAEGIATGQVTFSDFLETLEWEVEEVDKVFCHQVGTMHRRQMLQSLGVTPERDFSTLEWLGNTGSVALPLTMAIGLEQGHVGRGERVGMLGIGSGINSLMMAVEWQRALVGTDSGQLLDSETVSTAHTSGDLARP